MNLLYITSLNLDSNSGAIEHVLGISHGLAELGHQVHLVAATNSDEVLRQEMENLSYHLVPAGPSAAKTAARVSQKALQLVQEMQVDLVYLRPFPMDFLLLTRHLVKQKVLYVCELNDMTYQEYRAKGQRWRGQLYQFFERPTFRNSVGWLPVTAEIYRSALQVAGQSKPYLLAGNGVRVEEIEAKETRARKRKELGVTYETTVLVMAGFANPWHGVDRLISLFSKLEKTKPAELWLIGAQGAADRAKVDAFANEMGVSGSIRVFPWMNQEETADLVAAADVGIGSLALDRNQMLEAQPLKVRFYLALGLPVLLNFRDPRLAMHPAPFIAQIPSNDPSVLAEGVEKLLTPRMERSLIREYAQKHLSWRSISKETEAFLSTALKGAETYGLG